MAFGDLLKKVANKGLEFVGDAVEKGKQIAEEQGIIQKQKTPEELEAERLAVEKREKEEKAEKEKLAIQRKEAAELKKAQELEKILKPTCEKGDCLWNSGSFYYTCGSDVDCPRIKTTKKSWGGEVKLPELWPYMKRLEELQKLQKENSLSEKKEKEFFKDLLNEFMPNFLPYQYKIGVNVLFHGLINNKFFELLWDIRDIETKNLGHKIDVLESAYLDGTTLNLNNDFYRNPSLYNRNDEDFDYTVKTFEIVLDNEKLSTYFKDVSNISVEQLFDANGNIKPAGIGGPEAGFYDDTLWNTVESWSGDDSKNDNH